MDHTTCSIIRFAQPDASVIPARATLFVQLVQSDLLADMHRLRSEYRLSLTSQSTTRKSSDRSSIEHRHSSRVQLENHKQVDEPELVVRLPASAASCRGLGSVNDLQLSDLMEAVGDLRVLSAPAAALEFDWSARHPPLNEHRTISIGSKTNHTAAAC